MLNALKTIIEVPIAMAHRPTGYMSLHFSGP